MRFDRHPVSPLLICIVLLALAGGAPFLSGTHAGATAAETAVPEPAEGFTLDGADPANGEALFAKHCKVCHGAAGTGDGQLSEHLNPNPGDLRAKAAERSDWELYLTVRDGGKAIGLSPVMVGFGERLSEQELKDVTAFTRELATSDE